MGEIKKEVYKDGLFKEEGLTWGKLNGSLFNIINRMKFSFRVTCFTADTVRSWTRPQGGDVIYGWTRYYFSK